METKRGRRSQDKDRAGNKVMLRNPAAQLSRGSNTRPLDRCMGVPHRLQRYCLPLMPAGMPHPDEARVGGLESHSRHTTQVVFVH